MKRQLFTLFILLFALQAIAQYPRNLVLLSGNDEPMQVFINGKPVNRQPLKELRISGLTENFYQIKIRFAHSRFRSFSTELYVPPISEIVYAIFLPDHRYRNGEFVIKDVYPIDEDLPYYNPESVFSYGNGMNNNGGQNIQNGQINININNTAGGQLPGGQVVYVPGYEGTVGCTPPVTSERYKSMLQAVKKQNFDESKLRVAKQIIKQNDCMTVDQLVGIIRLLDFEKNKLELAKYAYHYIYDLENYYKVNNVFDFESSVKKLDAYIKNQ